MILYNNNIYKWQQRAFIIGTGIVQSGLIYLIYQNLNNFGLQPQSLFLQSFVIISIFLMQYISNGMNIKSMMLMCITVAAVISYTIYFTYSQLYLDANIKRGWGGLLGAGEGSYIILIILVIIFAPIWKTIHIYQKFSLPYQELTNHAWELLILTIYSLSLVVILWWVMDLYIEDKRSLYVLVSVSFAIVFALARESNNIIALFYKIITKSAKLILPIMCVILWVLFVLTLVQIIDFNASKIIYILGFNGAILLLYNLIYKRNYQDYFYPPLVQWLVKLSILIVPVYIILLLTILNLRIEQYGLTVARIWVFLTVILMLMVSTGYCLSILIYRRSWLRLIPITNKICAFIVLITLLMLHSKMFDPTHLAAKNQYNRLVDAKVSVSDFDYGYLEFELGYIGKYYLQKINNDKNIDNQYDLINVAYIKNNIIYDWRRFQQQKQLIAELGAGQEIADKINYAFLHFNMKKAGKQLLNKLLTMKSHPQYKMIKESISDLKPYKTWQEWNARNPDNLPDYGVKDHEPWDFNWDL